MLYVCICSFREGKLKEDEMSLDNTQEWSWKLSQPDVMYVYVENEKREKVCIMGILGKVKIHENIPMEDRRSLTLKGGTWVSNMQYQRGAKVFIETLENVWMVLCQIKEMESEEFQVIKGVLEKYCYRNFVHNYAEEYIMN